MTQNQIPFVLAMATMSGSPVFPIVVLDDEAAISVDALAPLAARLGHGLTRQESVFDLLQDWQRNFPALCQAVMALDDQSLGKYTRSAVSALEFFELVAPIARPRQAFCMDRDLASRPVSQLAGPTAKIPMPPGADSLMARAEIGLVVGAPCYLASAIEASQALAGFVVSTHFWDQRYNSFAPATAPIGPYFVPKAFTPETLSVNIAFNGEDSIESSFNQRAAKKCLQQVSSKCQLFPGDLIAVPLGEFGSPQLGDGDIIETAISGLGQQKTNVVVEGSHANSGN